MNLLLVFSRWWIISKAISAIAEETGASSQTVAASAEEQSASLHEVGSSSEAVAQMATELNAITSQFRV